MRTIVVAIFTLGLLVSISGCALFSGQLSEQELAQKVRQNLDPKGVLRSAKTQIIHAKVKRGPKLPPARVVIKVKYPDKWQMMAIIPKEGVFIRSYNGEIGWQFSSKKGYQQLHGKALDELKLQMALAVHRGELKQVFKSMKIVGMEKVAGMNCYKVECQPKDIYRSQPITYYIDAETFLPVKRTEIYDAPQGKTFPITVMFSNYEQYGSVKLAMDRIYNINGRLIDMTLVSVEWNEYIDDNDFTPPKALQ